MLRAKHHPRPDAASSMQQRHQETMLKKVATTGTPTIRRKMYLTCTIPLFWAEQLHLRVPPLVLPMELPPATITDAPLLLPCPAAGRAGDCPIHMPAVARQQVVQGQVCRGDQAS